MQNLTVIKFFIKDALSHFLPMLRWPKALVQDTSFLCDVGSNPTAADSFSFLPARRYARAGYSCRNVSGWLSVWLSCRLSVTAGIVSKRKQLASWFLHHLIAHWYRSLTSYDSSKNSQRVTPSEGNLWEWGGFERVIFEIFRPISRRISETVQDTTKVTIEH